MRRRESLVAVGSMAVALANVPMATDARGSWPTPVAVSPASFVFNALVGSDSAGAVTVAWQIPTGFQDAGVWVRHRSPEGKWGKAENVDPLANHWLAMDEDAAGNVCLLYGRLHHGNVLTTTCAGPGRNLLPAGDPVSPHAVHRLPSRRRRPRRLDCILDPARPVRPAAGWGSTHTLVTSRRGHSRIWAAEIATGGQATSVVTWKRVRKATVRGGIYAVVRHHGRWGTPRAVSPARGGSDPPAPLVSHGGTVWMFWQWKRSQFVMGDGWTVQARVRQPGGGRSALQVVSSANVGDLFPASLALLPSGLPAVTWVSSFHQLGVARDVLPGRLTHEVAA